MRAVAVLVILAFATGCAPQRRAAPVEDRRPPPRAQAPKAQAPVQTASPSPSAAPASAPATPEGFYTVKRGDTLYSIALDHGHDYRDVAQWNSLDDPTKLSVGQLLRVNPPAQPAVIVGSGRPENRIESRPLASVPGEHRPVTAEPRPTAPEPKPIAGEEPKLELHPLTFAWPVKGKVVAGFAEPRQKGIDIEGKSGDPVTAAAAGRVTYVGSGIPGLGKLIVIKHDQGYITVYAHNRDILVKEQQNVTRGQKIGELGDKLHFQIRKGAAAVDPLLYLPSS
ncbi:MAG TPA: peptidoglycan DD-metalloendopeptidase family protein [Burkholderiales bacterium]|nr:peptidoglycan DD-metalloendopeptidase family protein [Burkholderiales bacterium]